MPSVAIIGTRGYPSYYGGFETAVRKLAPYLADQGWDVTVYSRPGSTKQDEPGRDPRVRVIETRGLEKKSLSTLTYGMTAARHAAREKPDVALVMNVANGFWLPILRRAGIPTLVNVDGIEWDRAKWGRIAKWMFRRGAKLTARFGTHLVYDSHEIARRWQVEFDRDGTYIPYGGDPVPWSLPIEPGLSHRGYVLLVARFVPENTVAEFLAAAPLLAAHTDVVIVGSSGYGGQLDELAQELANSYSNIHWFGHVSDDQRLFSLWQHAGVYFHGHSVGGTNPALVQAMWCGAPVVARNTVYNVEVLGELGTFVEADPEAIASACLSVLRSPSRSDRGAQLALDRAHSRYSWASISSRYEDSLRKLLQCNSPDSP